MIVRNITFSADETLIERAREVAAARKRSLNEEFREWLAKYAEADRDARPSLREIFAQIPKVTLPKKYTREEMNERR